MAISLRLSKDEERKLDFLAKETHRTKTFYLRQAIADFLEEKADFYLALSVKERVSTGEEKLYSLEDVEKELDLKKNV